MPEPGVIDEETKRLDAEVAAPDAGMAIDATPQRFQAVVEVQDANTARSDGPVELVSIPPRTWVKLGDSWAEADRSRDPEQQVAADIGGLLASAADPEPAVDLLAGARTGTVADATEELKRPDGTTVTAWRLTSAPFTADGSKVSDPVVWLDESFAPAGMQATVAADGSTSTTTRYFTSLGEPQEVAAPR